METVLQIMRIIPLSISENSVYKNDNAATREYSISCLAAKYRTTLSSYYIFAIFIVTYEYRVFTMTGNDWRW